MPRPFAAYAPDTITIGSASKSFWGGLRLGWIRAPARPDGARSPRPGSAWTSAPRSWSSWCWSGCSRDADEILAANRARLREQRDALVAAVARAAAASGRSASRPAASPSGASSPAPSAPPLVAEAERRGVIIAPGPVFAAEGGLDRFVRIPWTRPADELTEAVRRLADAWIAVRDQPGRAAGGPVG